MDSNESNEDKIMDEASQVEASDSSVQDKNKEKESEKDFTSSEKVMTKENNVSENIDSVCDQVNQAEKEIVDSQCTDSVKINTSQNESKSIETKKAADNDIPTDVSLLMRDTESSDMDILESVKLIAPKNYKFNRSINNIDNLKENEDYMETEDVNETPVTNVIENVKVENDAKKIEDEVENADKSVAKKIENKINSAKDTNDTDIVENTTKAKDASDKKSTKDVKVTKDTKEAVKDIRNVREVMETREQRKRKSTITPPSHSSPSSDQQQQNGSSASSKRKRLDTSSTAAAATAATTTATAKDAQIHDRFCWRCHKESVEMQCSACPRSWHRRCMGGAPPLNVTNWLCGECAQILQADNAETRSPAMAQLSLEQLCMMLRHIVQRMRDQHGSGPFLKAVDLEEIPDYLEYVVKPMDLSLLEQNVRAKMYGSTDAFMADARWILHNCIVFNTCGGIYADTSKLTNTAKQMLKVARQEVSEIEACPDCFAHGRNLPRPLSSWFIEPCRRPHAIVWAKLKGFPFWPAKAMPRLNAQGLVDVRFFGEHDRAWVSPKDIYLYSEEPPAGMPRKKKVEMELCVKEVRDHAKKLEQVFGEFRYAPPKVQYDPHDPLQIQVLLPNYDPVLNKKIVPAETTKAEAQTPTNNKTVSARVERKSMNTRNIVASDTNGEMEITPPERRKLMRQKRPLTPSPQRLQKLMLPPPPPSLPLAENKISKSIAEKISKPTPEKVSKPTSEKVSKPTPEKIGKPTSEKISKQTAEKVSKPTPEKVSKPTPEKVTKTTSEKVTKISAEKHNKAIPEKVNKSNSEKISKLSPEVTVEPSPEKIIKLSPEKIIKPNPEKVIKPIPELEQVTIIAKRKSKSPPSALAVSNNNNSNNNELNKSSSTITTPSIVIDVLSSEKTSLMKSLPLVKRIKRDFTKKIKLTKDDIPEEPKKLNTIVRSSSASSITKPATVVHAMPPLNSLPNNVEIVKVPSPNKPKNIQIHSGMKRTNLVPYTVKTNAKSPLTECKIIGKTLAKVATKEATKFPTSTVQKSREDVVVVAGKPMTVIPVTVKKDQKTTFNVINSSTSESTKHLNNDKDVRLNSTVTVIKQEPKDDVQQPKLIITRKLGKARKSLPNKSPRFPQQTASPLTKTNVSASGDAMVYIPPQSSNEICSSSTVDSSSCSCTYKLPPPEAGPATAQIHQNSKELANKVAQLIADTIKEAAESNGVGVGSLVNHHEATIHYLKLKMERMKWEHEQKVAELRHNNEMVLRELRTSCDVELHRQLQAAEAEKQRCVEETKRKQWCVVCGREAMFFCCWNTAYCDYPCQQKHWASHVATCAQKTQSSSSSSPPHQQSQQQRPGSGNAAAKQQNSTCNEIEALSTGSV